jgi:hypothetical protein
MAKTELPQVKGGKRYTRRQAMARAREKTGRPVSATTLVYTWKVPYYRDGRDAIYLEDVLDAHINEHLAAVEQQVHCYEGAPRSKPPVNRIAGPDAPAASGRRHKAVVKGNATALAEQL